jgi:hypothetical protein
MNMITEKDYLNLKEYWDYQRKIQYNREEIEKMAADFEGRLQRNDGFAVTPLSANDVFDMIWNKMRSEDYQDPPKGWVPNDPQYKKWNE